MFFDADRIAAVREMILADDEAGRRAALAKILPMQRGDFVELFTHHGGPAGHHPPARPAAARVPAAHARRTLAAVAEATGLDAAKLMRRARELRETNPMLGHRGCRLGISYPEIYEMQVRAIIEAALRGRRVRQAPRHARRSCIRWSPRARRWPSCAQLTDRVAKAGAGREAARASTTPSAP